MTVFRGKGGLIIVLLYSRRSSMGYSEVLMLYKSVAKKQKSECF